MSDQSDSLSSHSEENQTQEQQIDQPDEMSEKRKMQVYLHQEILSEGYDAEVFAEFMADIKEDGCNLDHWSFDELEQAVQKFKQQQTSQEQVEVAAEEVSENPVQIEVSETPEIPQVESQTDQNTNLTDLISVEPINSQSEQSKPEASKKPPPRPLKIKHTDKFLESKQKILAQSKSKPLASDIFDLFADIEIVKNRNEPPKPSKPVDEFDLLSAPLNPIPINQSHTQKPPANSLDSEFAFGELVEASEKEKKAPTNLQSKAAPTNPSTLTLKKQPQVSKAPTSPPSSTLPAPKDSLKTPSASSHKPLKVTVTK